MGRVKEWTIENPRSTGIYCAIAGLAFSAVLWALHIRWYKLHAIASGLVLLGIWISATGRIHYNTEDSPWWWLIGFFVCSAIALAVTWLILVWKP